MPWKSKNPYTPSKECGCNWIKALFTLEKDDQNYLRICSGPHRKKYIHVVVWESIAGRKVKPDHQVHHQDGDRECCCPHNLCEMPKELNKPEVDRHPYTGRYLTKREAVEWGLRPDPEVPF